MDNTILLKLLDYKMPFGKYQDVLIRKLPEHYLVWFKQQGFPDGMLGEMLHTM